MTDARFGPRAGSVNDRLLALVRQSRHAGITMPELRERLADAIGDPSQVSIRLGKMARQHWLVAAPKVAGQPVRYFAVAAWAEAWHAAAAAVADGAERAAQTRHAELAERRSRRQQQMEAQRQAMQRASVGGLVPTGSIRPSRADAIVALAHRPEGVAPAEAARLTWGSPKAIPAELQRLAKAGRVVRMALGGDTRKVRYFGCAAAAMRWRDSAATAGYPAPVKLRGAATDMTGEVITPAHVRVQRCPSVGHDPRYQVGPGERVEGAGFARAGLGRYGADEPADWVRAALGAAT